jgi:glucose-6-phosphate-specific signal transduction histidine kinase
MSHDAVFVVLFVGTVLLLALKNGFGLSSRLDRLLDFALVLAAIWFATEVGGWQGLALLIGAVAAVEIIRVVRKRWRVA